MDRGEMELALAGPNLDAGVLCRNNQHIPAAHAASALD